LAVFDVDGTLVDSQHHIHSAMELTFAGQGLACPSLEQVRGIVGLSLPQAMRHLIAGQTDAQYNPMVEGFKATFNAGRLAEGLAPLYSGVSEMLDQLALNDHQLLGLATGNSRRGLDAVLEGHGLASHFVTSQVADNHPSKPHPSMLLAALSETGVEAQDAVMIGDTTYDMEMGVAAGMHCIGVSWGYHTVDDLRTAGAAWIVDDAAELQTLLDGFWR
jgi:phosphoglycolate phosphatase